ncbi:MAG: UDP-2,3-diacylglucosamine diphosphatase [Burkholderiales bacterium]|jgi:UDP-2,3-diacylglucosamine hydrolase|nr:UDP-2,3-diacylglucosamine diphosphatase [Burkholderiales bacterium]MBP8183209.1 UDP-2,3-diacylglucosamine diphosphatase [Rhodoferax sp.]
MQATNRMELLAPSRWRSVDFISDLHLQASNAQTFAVWSDYLQTTTADAVIILGDLFEVWVGDDCLSQEQRFEHDCVNVLRSAGSRLDLYIMPGNRDFLMGRSLMAACRAHALNDPTVLVWGPQRWLLTHGDALCLDDTAYMDFRAMVRSPQWRTDFLHKPISERIELARSMRMQSEARKQAGTVYSDVDGAAAEVLLQRLSADHMIHGHTHRPGLHCLQGSSQRWVLSDWDLQAQPARAEVLRLTLPIPQQEKSSANMQRLAWPTTKSTTAD